MTISRIRADVTIVKPVASTVLAVPGATQDVLTAGVKAATVVVVPITAISWINIVYEAALDYRGLNPVLREITVTMDGAALHLFKSVFDTHAAVDEETFVFVKKGPSELLHTNETRTFSLQRRIEDVVDATDDLFGEANADDEQTMWLAKSLQPDYVSKSDVQHALVGKRATDVAQSHDVIGPFAVGKGLTDTPHTSELKTFNMSKSLADVVDATDDLYGAANIDDEETMFLAKSAAPEAVHTADSNVRGVGKSASDMAVTADQINSRDTGKALSDVPQTSDLKTFGFSTSRSDAAAMSDGKAALVGKSASDAFSTTDAQTRLTGKARTDVATTSDAINTKGYGKASNDIAATSESRQHDISKELADATDASDDFNLSAVTDDGETMTFGKQSSDYVATSEEQLLFSTTKLLADTPLTSEAVSSEVGKPLQDAFATSDVKTAFVGKAAQDTFASSDAARVTAQKSLTDRTVLNDGPGYWVDYVELSYFATDYASHSRPALDIYKGVTDSAHFADSLSYLMVYNRSKSDPVATIDLKAFYMARALADQSYLADASVSAFGKARSDSASTSETKGFGVSKQINEYLDATDDFYGVTNADDDQTVAFATTKADTTVTSEQKTFATIKQLLDSFATSDLKTYSIGKPLADTVGKSDAATKTAGKSLSDTFSKSDSATSFVGKAKTDTATTSESMTRGVTAARSDSFATSDSPAKGFSRALADTFSKSDSTVRSFVKAPTDSATTGETKAFAISKALADIVHSTDDFYGVANADDDETMSYSKVSSDTVLKSDTARVVAGKGLTDSVNRSDSGSLRMTGYCDVNYFAADFIGTSLNF